MTETRAARVQAFYDEFAPDYDAERYQTPEQLALDAAAKRAMMSLLKGRRIDGMRVLDCGCGTGRFTKLFSELGAAVTGVDASPQMLEIARAKAPGATFALADVRKLDVDGRFDLVVCSQVLTHLHEYEAPLRGMREHLNPGGTIVIDVRNLLAPRNLAYRARALVRSRVQGPAEYDPDFVTWLGISSAARRAGLEIRDTRGISHTGSRVIKSPVLKSVVSTLVLRLEPPDKL